MPREYPDEIRMPWGKYRNKELQDIPSSYLYWLAENSKDDYIATAADVMWRFREEHGDHWEEGD